MSNCWASIKKVFSRAWFRTMLLLLYTISLTTACNKDNETKPYPSLITEFVDIPTDEDGVGEFIINDNANKYLLSTPFYNLQPSVIYRVVCGYEISDKKQNIVTIFTLETAKLLKEKKDCKRDALNAATIWKGGSYLNMQLRPKTQGGEQDWGFHIDNKETRNGINIFHLSLYHHQQDDPLSYSTTVYASLYLPNITDIQKGDSIYFTATTFEGDKKWSFTY